MLEIFKSILIVVVISGTVTTICNVVYGISPHGVFALATIIQFALSWYITTYYTYKNRLITSQQQTALISQIESEATEAPCAYCGEINLIPVSPTEDNDFICTGCNEANSVYVNITIAQKSVPLDIPEYNVTNYNTRLEQVKKTIQDEG